MDFRLVDWLARTARGTIALRIDDMDAVRSRPEYVDDVFEVLAWLGIEWSVGPHNRADFEQRFSQAARTEFFRAELHAAVERGLTTYACSCSRAMQKRTPMGGCVGRCWERNLAFEPGRTALRVRVPPGAAVDMGDRVIRLDEAMGDFVVWRRDDLPAYQLASVLLDRDLGVTHVVRGVDLIDSTAAQLFLAPFVDASTFAEATFIHHELVLGPHGGKLSKSRHQPDALLDHSPAGRALVDETAVGIGARVGIHPVS